MSPFSVAAVIAMAYAGAKQNTAHQIQSALRIPDNNSKYNRVVGQLVKAVKVTVEFSLFFAHF